MTTDHTPTDDAAPSSDVKKRLQPMEKTSRTRARLPRPVRLALAVIAFVAASYSAFSWVQGYDVNIVGVQRDGVNQVVYEHELRDSDVPLADPENPGQAWVRADEYRPGPVDALRHIGQFFPEFFRSLVPLLFLAGFYMGIIVLQFVGMFWYLSRGQSYTIYPGEYDVTFDDVRGQPAIVDATKEVVRLFEGFKEFRKMGGYPPHGILFEGPPGTGKTLLGKAIAGQTNVPFLYSNGTAFTSMFMGVGNMKVKSMFRKARKLSKDYDGAVIFIDELDAVAGSRGEVSNARVALDAAQAPNGFMMGMGNMNSLLVNELLVQMDGLVLPNRRFRHVRRWLKVKPKVPNYNLLIIGATNRAAVLDPALLRPGRFDRKIHVGNPSGEGRKDIFEYYLAKVNHDPAIDYDRLVNATVGYSPAQIKNLVNEGLIFALQSNRDAVTFEDIWQAKLTDEIGIKQPVTYSAWEKEATAIHEGAHAVAAYFLDPGRWVAVITIQKRETYLGFVHGMELEERFSTTRDEYLADIKVSLAGLCAEQLWYDQSTSGASADLKNATTVALQMVAFYGMGTSLTSAGAFPPPAYGGNVLASLLGDGPTKPQVDDILNHCRAEVTELLKLKAHCVEAVRDELLVKEQLTGDEFAALMESLGEERDDVSVGVRQPPKRLSAFTPTLVPATNGDAAAGAATDKGGVNEPEAPSDVMPPSSPWSRPPQNGDDS